MAIEPDELEEIPPQGHVKIVYTGSVAPHWEIHRVFGDQRAIDEFRQRAMARLQLLPVYDPQFRRNRERVARDAEREHLILEWDLGDEPEALIRRSGQVSSFENRADTTRATSVHRNTSAISVSAAPHARSCAAANGCLGVGPDLHAGARCSSRGRCRCSASSTSRS